MTEMNNYYFKEMEKIPLLSVEEERSLATKAFSGDKTAQKKLVEANLRFVVKIAAHYQGYMEMEDLINEGNLGLMHAATKFDPSTENRFTTYAQFWIKAYIQKAIRETSKLVRFPATKFEELKKWQIACLDKPVVDSEGEETTLLNFIKDDRRTTPEVEYYEKELTLLLNEMIKLLKPNEQLVIVNRFGLDGKEPMSLSEIGAIMGYSKERIRQIEKKALLDLRKNIGCTEDCTAFAA